MQFCGVDHGFGLIAGHGAGQLGFEFRGAGGQWGCDLNPFSFAKPAVEGFYRGEFAGERAGANAAVTFVGHPCPHVGDFDLAEFGFAHIAAKVIGQKSDETSHVPLIGFDGFVSGPLQSGDAGKPTMEKIKCAR